MSGTLLLIVLAGVVPAVVPVVILSAQCLLALIPYRPRRTEGTSGRPTVAVLVPAHNEEGVIGPTIDSIMPQLRPGDRLLVIADNCTDQTVGNAAAAGAEVIERHDAVQRGKGFALAAGVTHLCGAPTSVILVVDADCLCSNNLLECLAQMVGAFQRPVQCIDLLKPPSLPRPTDRVSAFAFLVKNLVRPLGGQRMGIPCLLRGTGMAFPWEVIRHAPLASGNIVEDLQLGIDLAFAGHAPIFCPDASVMGTLPSDPQAAAKQRRRWEHGHLHTITHTAIPMFWRALYKGRLDLLLLALDVAIPPLSLLVLFWGLLGGGLSVLTWITGAVLPMVVWSCVSVLLVIALLSAWFRFGRKVMSAGTLTAIPFYVLAKIPLYLGYLISPQREWVRTDREVAPNLQTAPSGPSVLPPK